MDYRAFYESNKDFKEYVDQYCKTYGFTVEEALQRVLVHLVAAQYREKEETICD